MSSPVVEMLAGLTSQERRLRLFLRILGFLFLLGALGYLLPALYGPMQSFYIQLPFVTNSVVKVGVLALLALLAAADVRRRELLTLILILAHIMSVLTVTVTILFGKTDYQVNLFGNLVPITQILLASIALDGFIVGVLSWLSVGARRSRVNLNYLSETEFRALTALADVVIKSERRLVTPQEIAGNIDRYLASFAGRGKWIAKLTLTALEFSPLLYLKLPLSRLDSRLRLEFLRERFYRDVDRRLVPPFWRIVVQAMIRFGKQLCYIGYYKDPRTFASVGYVPFSQRADTAMRIRNTPIPSRRHLHVVSSADLTGDTESADVVIVGSGAAGSVLAYGLAELGREVLMIERGDHVDPSEFTEDEMEMLSKLYADGALQLSRDFQFQVLQGSCVGGTTVVNNAVCFDLPPAVLDRWNHPGRCNAGLDAGRLGRSFAEVRALIGVERQDHNRYLSPGAAYVTKGVGKLGLDQPPNQYEVVEADIHGCLGCGYCNIGCGYGRKLSMLDTLLPRTQEKFGSGALRIIAGCEAQRLHGRGGTITSIRCRLKDGRQIDVRAKTFVIAAGAISSSLLLQRSGVRNSQVGRQASFNVGSPMIAVFKEVVNAFDGLQITHALRFPSDHGYVMETWFNPPVTQAAVMPGWFEDHFTNMLRYNHMTGLGVLVGSESNGVIRAAGPMGRQIDYKVLSGDLAKLLNGLVRAGEILLEGGAEIVMPNTFKYYEFRTKEELRMLPQLVRDPSDIGTGTGHPQGGNAISANHQRGVVNPNFQVYGYKNLFVCDASVFPTSLGVNPQLTVMALAHYAVPLVAESR